ncbi:MAG: hypothetical protein JWO84_493 [Parcubacteria group bacterium]|nr:hypothetical protein [Parcubacteria group bacterium]
MSLNAVAVQTARAPGIIGTGTCRHCDRAEVNCTYFGSGVRGLVSHDKPGLGAGPCENGEGSPPRHFVNMQC